MDMPSNSGETTEKLLQSYLKAIEARSDSQNPDFFFAVADIPLYVSVIEEIYNTASGAKRNELYGSIELYPGGMHFLCQIRVLVRGLHATS